MGRLALSFFPLDVGHADVEEEIALIGTRDYQRSLTLVKAFV